MSDAVMMVYRWPAKVGKVLLAGEAVNRATSTVLRPSTYPLLELSIWTVVPLSVAAVLIVLSMFFPRRAVGHWFGFVGHLAGAGLALIFGMNVYVQAAVFGLSWSTAGLAVVTVWGHLLVVWLHATAMRREAPHARK